jgi:transcription elongation factor Elf1
MDLHLQNQLERILFDCSTCGDETEQRLLGRASASVLLYECQRCDSRLAYRVDIVRRLQDLHDEVESFYRDHGNGD